MNEDTENVVKIISEKEEEFRTYRIVRIEGDLFLQQLNGGSRGAYEERDGFVNPTDVITATRARQIMLSWGVEPDHIVELMK